MGVLGNSHILNLFMKFQHSQLTYQHPVPQDLGFRPQSTTLKLLGQTRPCVLHSLSFSEAMVIIRLTTGDIKELNEGSHLCVLKLEYQQNPKSPVEEYVFSGKFHVQSTQKCAEGQYILLLRQDFNHRPAEGFIELQGGYMKLKEDAGHREDARIPVSQDSLRFLGFVSAAAEVVIESVPRKCLLKEVSYSGARLLVEGAPHQLHARDFELKIATNLDGILCLPGTVMRAEEVHGHKDLSVLGLMYNPSRVPSAYLRAVQNGLDKGLVPAKHTAKVTSTRTPGVMSVDPATGRLIRG